MSTYIAYDQTYTGTGEQQWLPLSRWNQSNTAIVVKLDGAATYTLEGTINKVNRGEDILTFELQADGAAEWSTDLTYTFKNVPLEAIRINPSINASGIRFQVLQAGNE